MNKLNLFLINLCVLSSLAMEPIRREKAGSQELALSRSTPESSSSDKAVLEDIEIGQGQPVRATSGSRIYIDKDGKRKSIQLALADVVKNIISEEADLNDPAITQKAKEALCNQMAKDLLNIVYNPEDNKAHKKYKFVKKSLAKALAEEHDSPRNDNILEEIRCLRKVSVKQISARKSAKISKSNPASAVTATRAAATTPSPRDLFLQNSPTQSDQAYAELGKLLQEQLAKEGASQEKQKFWASVVAVGGPLVSAGITALLYKFTGCPSGSTNSPTNSSLPL